ncbi:CDGP domain-containing protein [Mycobacterium sp. LTG2003]
MRAVTVRRMLGAMAAGAVLMGTGIAYADHAKASPGLGCETIAAPGLLNWGQKRTICDTPRNADGSWWRSRKYWTPAHYVPVSCYRWSCTGGYYVGDTVSRYEEYPVNDRNVLADEPGWLPTGSVVIR